MKKLAFSALMALLVLTSGAAFAQIIPPGPTAQQEPDLNNNNLPNPGNPVDVGTQPTTVMPETETGTGVDVDVDTGSKANGLVDVDVTKTTDADTDASGVDETGGLSNDTETNTGTLPGTASGLPAVALLGLLAMAAAFAVRFLRS
jgi:hypothetical protein